MPQHHVDWLDQARSRLIISPMFEHLTLTVAERVATLTVNRPDRLNALNAGKSCRYFWQATHVFQDGGSHGSAGRTASESQRPVEPGAASDGGGT